MKTLRSALLAGVLLIVLVSSLFPASVRAQEPPPPENPPEEEPVEGERSGILTHIFKLIFPVETMQAATETLLVNILQRNAEGVEAFFSRIAIGMTLLNPGVKTPACNGLGVWRDIEGEGVFVPTWNFSVKIAVALWPATLAIMAAMAAGQSAISTSWGVTNLKGAMAEWLTGVLLCAFSLEILDLINRLSNAIIVGIIEMPIGVSVNLQKIVGWILSAPLKGSSSVPVVAALIAILAELVLGIALVISLFGQLFARGALLYVIVAITPLVLVISILPPARWLRWLWVKGILLVMLLGPITALLLKLLAALHRVLTDRHILGFVMIVGVLSVLLAINGAIIKGVFGAAGEVLGKAQQTATGIVRGVATAGAAAAAVVLSGGAALGALPGIAAASGGATAAGVGAAAGGGSAGSAVASLATGSAESAAGSATGGGGSAAGGADGSATGGAGSTTPDTPAARPGPDTGGAAPTFGGGKRGAPQGETPTQGGSSPATGTQAAGDDSGSYWDKLRKRWNKATPHERTEAIGTAMRGAGRILGPRSLTGRAMEATGMGLQTGARRQADELAAQPEEKQLSASPSGANVSTLSPNEVQGYQEAMRDARRDLRTPMEAAGLDFRQVERDAMAPVWAAAQHNTLTNVARQAGFGDRSDTTSIVSDFLTSRVEGQLMTQGFLSQRITRPGAPSTTPLSDTPTLFDYDRGQQLAWAAGGGNLTTYGGLHHAMRRYADTPSAGLDAANGFYAAAIESGGVAGVIGAAREYGAQAGVPGERLEPWLQELQAI
jgi:hypothetical protein